MSLEQKLHLAVAGMWCVFALCCGLFFICCLMERRRNKDQRYLAWSVQQSDMLILMHVAMRRELQAQYKAHKKKNHQLAGLRVNRSYMNMLAHVYRARIQELEDAYEDMGYRAHVSQDWLIQQGKLPPRENGYTALYKFCQDSNHAVLDQMPALPLRFTLPISRA